MKSSILFPILLLLAALQSYSQTPAPTPKPTPPPGPLIQKRAPSPSLWRVTTIVSSPKAKDNQHSENPSKANASPEGADKGENGTTTQNTFLKGSNNVVRVNLGAGKDAVTIWCLAGVQVAEWPGNSMVARVPDIKGPNPLHVDLSRTDFPELAWISPDAYNGEYTYNGARCLYYSKKVELPSDVEGSAPTQATVKAFVEIESRLPLAMVRDGQLTTWAWGTAPQAPLSLPSAVAALLDDQKRQARMVVAEAVKPR